MTTRDRFKIGVALWLLCMLMMAVAIQACSTTRKSRQVEKIKVDSSAVSVNTYEKQTKITETGSDSIANPVKPFIAPLNTEDTAEKTFETDIMTVKVKTGKNGKISINPKQHKLPVPPSTKTTETKETGTNVQAVNKTTETKKVEDEKQVVRVQFWTQMALLLIIFIPIIIWLAKKILTRS